jgi:hypothetical protein
LIFFVIFEYLKKLAHISLSVILAFSILFGYAGVPVYKMICSEDGHVQVSLTHDDAACHHEKQSKSCCTPKQAKQEPKEERGCCDYSNAFFQLEEISPVAEQQNTTGHVLSAIAVLFTPFTIEQHLAALSNSNILHAPPLITRKQCPQSITQVFRI